MNLENFISLADSTPSSTGQPIGLPLQAPAVATGLYIPDKVWSRTVLYGGQSGSPL